MDEAQDEMWEEISTNAPREDRSVYTGPERRTLVRRRLDPFRADVLRKERSIFDGQVEEGEKE